MSMIMQMESNIGSMGYMPELSSTIKNLAINATGWEVFDLGADWRLINNILFSLVNSVVSTGGSSTIKFSFADVAQNLNTSSISPNNSIAGYNPAGSVASSYGGQLGNGFFATLIRVAARYVSIRVVNANTAPQGSNTYVDLRCFGLIP